MDQPGSSDVDLAPHDLLVVGIGASAGGLEALKEFLRGLPPEPGFAIDHEAESEDGRCFLRRVLPYRGPARTADGIVVTFTAVTKQKAADEATRTCKINLALEPEAPLTFEQLQADVHMEFDPAGLKFTIVMPVPRPVDSTLTIKPV